MPVGDIVSTTSMRLLFVVTIVLAIVACNAEDKVKTSCADGQVWKSCGSACTKTCDEPNPICTKNCVAKCECPSDQPFWQDGKCVSKQICKLQKCIGGQVWKSCGSACTKTCDLPNPMCTRNCVAKCECPSDKPIWRDGECVAEQTCKLPKCIGGQVWKACGSACTKTCDLPNPMCTRNCVAKCECPSDKPIWRDGECVAETTCKLLKCIGGQVWKACGSACTKTCDLPNPMCTQNCVAKCECPNDKPIWLDGECVAEKTCKLLKCIGGQVWKACGSACTKTCDLPNPMCTLNCVAKCECPSDKPIWWVGECVAEEACSRRLAPGIIV